jgi:hypothetical protein
MLILFAVTGAAQMVGLKLGILSEAHVLHFGSVPFIILSVCMGLSVVVTAILGIAMALRYGGNQKVVWACLIFGVLFPTVLLMMSHKMTKSKKPAMAVQQTQVQGTP